MSKPKFTLIQGGLSKQEKRFINRDEVFARLEIEFQVPRNILNLHLHSIMGVEDYVFEFLNAGYSFDYMFKVFKEALQLDAGFEIQVMKTVA